MYSKSYSGINLQISKAKNTEAPFTRAIFPWQVYLPSFIAHVDDQQVFLYNFPVTRFPCSCRRSANFPWQVSVMPYALKINNILATFSLLSVYTNKFMTWQFFRVKKKLARQIFLDKENLPTIPHLHEQFFLVKANLSRKNCSCKWGFSEWYHSFVLLQTMIDGEVPLKNIFSKESEASFSTAWEIFGSTLKNEG